ncbi:Cytoplasmic protein NCK2 [Balamuthia mandrillaris]
MAVRRKGSKGDVAEATQGRSIGYGSSVRVLYDYEAEEEGEMTVFEDDIITVLAEEPSGWWKGESNGQVGVFPKNFTEPYVAGPSSQGMILRCFPDSYQFLPFFRRYTKN